MSLSYRRNLETYHYDWIVCTSIHVDFQAVPCFQIERLFARVDRLNNPAGLPLRIARKVQKLHVYGRLVSARGIITYAAARLLLICGEM